MLLRDKEKRVPKGRESYKALVPMAGRSSLSFNSFLIDPPELVRIKFFEKTLMSAFPTKADINPYRSYRVLLPPITQSLPKISSIKRQCTKTDDRLGTPAAPRMIDGITG